MSDIKYTGEHMKALRLSHKFESVGEWADLLGCNRNTIYAVEESKQLTCGWRIVHLYITAHGLGALYEAKRKRKQDQP